MKILLVREKLKIDLIYMVSKQKWGKNDRVWWLIVERNEEILKNFKFF